MFRTSPKDLEVYEHGEDMGTDMAAESGDQRSSVTTTVGCMSGAYKIPKVAALI